MVDYTEEAVYADKGFANKSRRKKLGRRNIFDGILSKGYRDKQLSRAAQRINRIFSRVRNKVERPFAYIKRILNYQRCSYYDLRRNRFEFMHSILRIISAFVVYNNRKRITLKV
ncbi:MAG: transposase [Candidatus Woesearchaeota archaeon]